MRDLVTFLRLHKINVIFLQSTAVGNLASLKIFFPFEKLLKMHDDGYMILITFT